MLTTPNETNWPGVSSLREYKATFPNWSVNNLASHAKNIDDQGMDLLQVSYCVFLMYYTQAIARYIVIESFLLLLFFKEMLIYNPEKRISARNALKHPFFDTLDKSKLPASDS